MLRNLGAGLVAGVSDNDPTSVATLAVIGATTTYSLAWLVVLLLPMLITIQVISARVGVVTHRSLERVIRDRCGVPWALAAMLLVLAVNLITVAADLEAGAAALGLFTGLPWTWFVFPLAVLIGILLVVASYRQISQVLRYVLLVFLAYPAAAFLAHPDWPDVLRQTLLPSIQLTPDYVTAILALLGTSLTSYVYFWETIEEEQERPPRRLLPVIELDAGLGIAFTVLLFWTILVSTGATLGVKGQPVQTAQDAAQALVPLAGPLAGWWFALGLLASALLAVPVIAATTGYVVGQAFGRPCNLDEPPSAETWPFYAALLGSLAFGAALSLLGVEPIRLLFLASIAGGLGTPVLLVLLLVVAGSPTVMGQHRISGVLAVIGWATALIVSAASLLYLVQQFGPGASS